MGPIAPELGTKVEAGKTVEQGHTLLAGEEYDLLRDRRRRIWAFAGLGTPTLAGPEGCTCGEGGFRRGHLRQQPQDRP